MSFKDLVQDVLGNVTECLGEDATFAPCKGSSFTVRVVFDNNAEIIDPDMETVVQSNQPRVQVRLSDFPNGIKERDRFVLGTTTYRAWTVEEDGQGGAIVMLHKTRE